MEESLSVPTATSTRRVPVKVLEENRRIINENLQSAGRGKVSFTHLIAWAIIKSLKVYPQLNFRDLMIAQAIKCVNETFRARRFANSR